MPRELTRYCALTLMLVMTTACAGRAENTPTPVPTAAPTQAATATSVPAQAVAQPTAVPTDAPAAASGDVTPAGAVVTVEDAATINSYRLRVETISESARGTDGVEITGAFVKEPLAAELAVTISQGDRTDELGMIQVDGMGYLRVGDRWVQTPDPKLNIAELTLFTAADSAGIVGQMELVDEETVNDRPSLHYRGSKEIIPVVGTASDTLDVSRIEAAQIDVWVDAAFQVVSRFVLAGSDSGGASGQPLQFSVTYEYYDFNAGIVVAAPTTLVEPAAAATPVGEFVPRNELGALLGFDLLMPTGSSVETVVGTTLYVVVAPYTLEEATNMIEQVLPYNGYTQVSKVGPTNGQIVYLFQLDQKTVSVTLEDTGDGNTRFQFATTP